MSSIRWSRQEVLRIHRLITKGDLSQAQVARQYGVSRQRVNQVLKEHNLNGSRRVSG